MAKTFEWTVPLDSTTYEISLIVRPWSRNHICMVNGQRIPLSAKFSQIFVGLDHTLKLGDHEVHLIIMGSNADLAVNGTYLGTENPYMPFSTVPWWTCIFVALCAAIPVLALGGVVPVLLALFGSIYCFRTVITPYYSTMMKIGYCIAIVVAAWIALFLLVYLIYSPES
jgi:hypothetical protein